MWFLMVAQSQLLAMIPTIWILLLTPLCSALFVQEGGNCDLSREQKGICKRKSACSRVRTTKLETAQLEPCGFADQEQLFCCAPTTSRVLKACNKYKKRAIPKIAPFISGGRPAERGEFPHMVAIGYADTEDTNWRCGGSLISHHFVLTAAHCLTGRKPVKIRVGDQDLMSDADNADVAEYGIARVIIHPRYNPMKSVYNDIGLINTNETVKFTEYIYPACLQTSDSTVRVAEYSISGWGTTGDSKDMAISKYQPLRCGSVLAVENKRCDGKYNGRALFKPKYPNGIIRSLMCAQTPDGQQTDTCKGDSGGPLQYLLDDVYYIAGVTSFGMACGGQNPSVYTKVSRFAPWIEVFVWGK